jgi:two-component sensor histidine kinase/ABC-type uncharacterized transport system substrate-binding protein
VWGQSRPYRILILHSYQTDYPWVLAVQEGIINALRAADINKFEIKTEYLDSKRNWNSGKELLAFEYLKKKYDRYPFDGVITSDNDAYDLMRRFGNDLFGPVPWVFCGVNDPDQEELNQLKGRATGVIEYVNYEKTIRFITSVIPKLQKLYIVADETSTGIKNKREVQWVLQSLFPSIVYEVIQPCSYTEILAYISRLSPQDAILLLAYSLDSEGTYFPYQRIVKEIASSSPCPVFGVWDFNLGHGIVGGAITSGFIQGQEAGKMMLDILNGQRIGQISVKELKDTPYMADWNMMHKWHLPLKSLPDETVLINKPKNVIQENPVIGVILLSLICIIVMLTAFIIMLQKSHKKLDLLNSRLSQQLSEKASLLQEVNHRVRNNLQIIASLLHLQYGYTENEEVRSALLDMENRVRSMELVHSESYEHNNLDELELNHYIYMLGNYLTASYNERFYCSFNITNTTTKPYMLSLQRIIPLGLLFNEMITNSIKYARDDNGNCVINAELSENSDGACVIGYWDSGPGIPADIDFHKTSSLGFSLMNILATQAKVELKRDNNNLAKIYIIISK